MGATCVTTPVTGFDEYVDHGWNGLVVGWDDPHGTARALDLLARDRALLQRLRDNALATARAWPSWEQSLALHGRWRCARSTASRRPTRGRPASGSPRTSPACSPRASAPRRAIGIQRAIVEDIKAQKTWQWRAGASARARPPRARPRSGRVATRCAAAPLASPRPAGGCRAPRRRGRGRARAPARRVEARYCSAFWRPRTRTRWKASGKVRAVAAMCVSSSGKPHLDVVQAALEAVGRAQRLADHEVAGREVQAARGSRTSGRARCGR